MWIAAKTNAAPYLSMRRGVMSECGNAKKHVIPTVCGFECWDFALSIKSTNVGMAHDSKRHKWREKPESIKSQKNGICEKRKSQEGWEMSVSMGPTFLLFFESLCWDSYLDKKSMEIQELQMKK